MLGARTQVADQRIFVSKYVLQKAAVVCQPRPCMASPASLAALLRLFRFGLCRHLLPLPLRHLLRHVVLRHDA